MSRHLCPQAWDHLTQDGPCEWCGFDGYDRPEPDPVEEARLADTIRWMNSLCCAPPHA